MIEMMVAVSIFVIVALIVTGVLVQLSWAYKRAQYMRMLMDNLNFALEKMNLEIREGLNIVVIGDAIKFKKLGDLTTDYCYSSGASGSHTDTLLKCTDFCPCTPGSGNLVDMLSPEISLTKIKFKAFRRPSGRQARVLINIEGRAGTGKMETDFSIQSTAAQRNVDSPQ